MLFKTVLVSIKRDTNTVSRYVNQWEIPLLKSIHGDDDRCIVHDDVEFIEIDLDVQNEYRRLQDAYKRDADTFYRIYRSESELKKAIAEAEDDAPDAYEACEPEVAKPKVAKKIVLKKQVKVSV